jgi:pimeloyl-ACP methyl ester carboxylesterase
MKDIGYVFIPGGGMSSWVWRDLDQELSSRAVLVEGRLTNNILQERMHATLSTCVDHIEEGMRQAGYPEYVIIAHSGGGILAPLVAKRFPGKVKGIIFVSASIPRNHTNALDVMPLPMKILNKLAAKSQLRRDTTPARTHEKMIKKVFCNTASPEVVEYVLQQQLITEPLCAFFERVDWDGVPKIPMAYMRLLDDKTASLSMQDRMAANMDIRVKHDMPSDHMVMLSHPDQFNQAVHTLIGKLLNTA